MAAPSSFLIGGAPQQNFDYMAVANQRVRAMDAMVHTLGSIAKIGQDMYVSKVNKQLTEYSQMYESDLIKWKAENEGAYRTPEENLNAFESFANQRADAYKLAIGDSQAQQLFDENIFSTRLSYQTDAAIAGERYKQQDIQTNNKARVQEATQIIVNSDKDKIYESYNRQISLLINDADVQLKNKEISKNNYDGYVSDIKGLTRITIGELIKKDPVNALEFVETHKNDLDQSSYLDLRERALESRARAFANNYKTTQKSITAMQEEALTNGTSNFFKDENNIQRAVQQINELHKGDPLLVQQETQKLFNNFVVHDLAKNSERMTLSQLNGKLLDIQADQTLNGHLKESSLSAISKEIDIRMNQPITAALRADHVQQKYQNMSDMQTRYQKAFGDYSNWTDKQKQEFSASVRDYTEELINEQIRLGVPESSIQVFNEKTIAILQNQINNPRLEPTQLLEILNDMARMTGSERAFTIGLSQVEKGDPSGKLATASMFLSWNPSANDIYPINERAMVYALSVSTMDWPETYSKVDSKDRNRHREDISAAISLFTNTISPESRDGVINIAAKVYANRYAETLDEEASLNFVKDIFINSAFIESTDGGKASNMLVPNKYQTTYNGESVFIGTKPYVIDAAINAAKMITADEINPQDLLADIVSRDNIVLDEKDIELYKDEVTGMLARSRWTTEGEKLVLKVTNELGEKTEPVKLLSGSNVEIGLDKLHELYNLAYAEVSGSKARKVTESDLEVIRAFQKKFRNYLGLIDEDKEITADEYRASYYGVKRAPL